MPEAPNQTSKGLSVQLVKTLGVVCFYLVLNPMAQGKRIPDQSPLGTIDLATCAAAAKTSNQDYRAWANALEGRYRWYYPEMNKKELREYVDNVVFTKGKKLENRGIIKKEFVQNYFNQHCAANKP